MENEINSMSAQEEDNMLKCTPVREKRISLTEKRIDRI